MTGIDEAQMAFEALLGLDHSRRPPWGPLHAVAVACYLLQCTDVPIHRDDPRLEILHAFVSGGRPGLDAAVARLRGEELPSGGGAALAVPVGFEVTILDVSVDGSFPAEGYEQRVRRWASTTLAAWTGARKASGSPTVRSARRIRRDPMTALSVAATVCAQRLTVRDLIVDKGSVNRSTRVATS